MLNQIRVLINRLILAIASIDCITINAGHKSADRSAVEEHMFI